MNDVEELKRFVTVHANAQRIPRARCAEVLDGIVNDEEGDPGSWATRWSAAGRSLEREGRLLEACRHYNLARFPYVDGPARAAALEACVSVFRRWAAHRPELAYEELPVPGGAVRCWTTGLSRSGPRRPLLLLMGGIVSVKEQWAPVLTRVGRQGMAGIAVEMPGVGENGLAYGADSWRVLSGLLDALRDRADVSRTYALALSFSGHLALRCAGEDERLRGVVTAGAPVGAFFTDPLWQRRVPRVTVDTLAHLTGTAAGEVFGHVRGWALNGTRLGALGIPVAYLASRRDEIIPRAEVGLLRRHVRELSVTENDDVHGSPRHTAESGLWAVTSVLRMRGLRGPRVWALEAVLRMLRARGRLRRTP